MECTPNPKRAAKKSRNGNPNVVALWRRTRKGQKLAVWGEEVGGFGKNGSDYYEIRVGADGTIYCSCPDYRFRGFKSNHATGGTYICKHVRAFLAHVIGMINRGEAMDSECVLYQQDVALRYAMEFAPAIAAGLKSADRVAVN